MFYNETKSKATLGNSSPSKRLLIGIILILLVSISALLKNIITTFPEFWVELKTSSSKWVDQTKTFTQKFHHHAKPVKVAPEKPKPPEVKKPPVPVKPKFDFYTLLPKMEMNSESPKPKKAKNSPKESPRPISPQ